jgi:hypothetical protein
MSLMNALLSELFDIAPDEILGIKHVAEPIIA